MTPKTRAMRPAAIDAEARAILTRAATAEAERQRAKELQDWPRLAALETELRRLWYRHAELEHITG